MQNYRVGVVGTRTYNNYKGVADVLDNIKNNTIEIVTGGAQGIDSLAVIYARENSIPIKLHISVWNKYGKSAGPIRNKLIVQDSDMVIAFWDYKSPGIASTINLCNQLGNKNLNNMWSMTIIYMLFKFF